MQALGPVTGHRGRSPARLRKGRPPDMNAMFSSVLDDLVSAGTITAAQQTAIADALATALPSGAPGGGPAPTTSPTPQSSV